jgi:hypothetical protein
MLDVNTEKKCETCEGDGMVCVGSGTETGDGEYAPCPDCHQLSGTDYFLAGKGKNYRATGMNAQPLDPAKVRELMKK